MNKNAKPVEVELTRGAILPGELMHILTLAGPDAMCTMISVAWSDDYQASATDVDEVDPIEDAEDVKSVIAKFRYRDKSNLTISLRQHYRNTLEAVGEEARERQSAIAQYWASLPERSSLTFLKANWLRSLPIALCGGAITLLVAGFFFHSRHHAMELWTFRISFLLIAVCSYLFIRSTHAIRAFSRLVVLARRPHGNIWTVIAGVTAIGTLVLGLVAYFFPR